MKKLFYLVFAGALVFSSCKPGPDNPPVVIEPPVVDATVKTVKDNGRGTGNVTWSNDTIYLLDGFVFVNAGQTLTIEKGTIIKGKSGQGEKASALIVARGGKIMAEGTADMPIIFTSELDETTRNTGGILTLKDNLGLEGGYWGGLIILGNAELNSTPGETAIEGIPTTEERGIYGGKNDLDNSGTLKYVSIRHGGTDIGAGNEINGLTLGGVGSGTVIDYVEIAGNADDGIEFFGGTVQVKHAIVNNAGDDSFDYDEGYRGKGQFWVSINPADKAGEHDGGTNPETAQPYATPTIYNVTYLGGVAIQFRDNAGGYYRNSIFEGLSRTSAAIDVEDIAIEDSRSQFEAGRLVIENNVFVNCAAIRVAYTGALGVEIDEAKNTSTTTSLVSKSNMIPATTQSATSVTADSFFETAAYKGAFGSTNWAAGWTLTFPTK